MNYPMDMAFDYAPIPYGITDFVRIRKEGYYYVDKSMFIPQIDFDASFAFCLRPRRFGKSLLLNMLAAYYDVAMADQFDELFTGLYVHEHTTRHRGRYLIMKFNFTKVNPNAELVQESFNDVCMETVRSFVVKYRSLLPEDTMERFLATKTCDRAMDVVCNCAGEAGREIFVMIDEYDNFANTLMSHDENSYSDLTHKDGFFRFFFNNLKAYTTDNNCPVQRIFITGVSPITLSDVTSGFNIGNNLSMMSRYNAMVGLTESQVRDILEYYRSRTGVFNHSIEELVETMKPWYDNYCFSMESLRAERMFNTDMVLYFIQRYCMDGIIPREMIDMNVRSDYNKMQQLVRFEKTYGPKTQMIQQLLAQGCVCTSVNPEFQLNDMDKPENLYSLLFYLGLLSFSGEQRGVPVLSIPNQVVKAQYYQYLIKSYTNTLGFVDETVKMNNLMMNLAWDGDYKPFFEFITQRMQTVSSVRDYVDGETFVKAFFLSNMAGMRESNLYEFRSEPEANKGYVDIMMVPRGQVQNLFLIELKYAKANEKDTVIDALHRDAIEQLDQYEQDAQFQSWIERHHWTVNKVVIVFSAWEMVVCE